MKNEVNRALVAKKKSYNQPIVEAAEVLATSIMQVTSPNGLPVGDSLPGDSD